MFLTLSRAHDDVPQAGISLVRVTAADARSRTDGAAHGPSRSWVLMSHHWDA